jgi:hypothetical protein
MRRTVSGSTNVIHCRSARTPSSVKPFATGPPVVKLLPLFGDVELTKPVSGPSPVYA